jgi:hypothetical protein
LSGDSRTKANRYSRAAPSLWVSAGQAGQIGGRWEQRA